MPSDPPRTDDGRGDHEPPPEPLHELTLGRRSSFPAEANPSDDSTSSAEATDADLGEIEARCRLKAEAARWASECQRRIRGGVGLQPDDGPPIREVIEWTDKLTDCFYWMNTPDASTPDISLLDDVGGCYEALAEAFALLRNEGRRGVIERALQLLAEAQSALRRSLQRLQAPDDPDQVAAYEWVRETAARHRIYLKRYMRADDHAGPSRWPDLLARIEALADSGPQSRERRARIERVRQHVQDIRAGHGTDRDWQAAIEGVDVMVGEGVPPSDPEIRDLLLPVIDGLPDRDDLPPGFRLVLREIDRYLATRPPPATVTSQVPSAEAREAARLLGGRTVVLIGGVRRPEAQRSLESALGLKELAWIETREHQSIEGFETAIARPDVALVLLAIRWSSHAFGDVKRYCDRHGKPLVRLPGGYHPNQVAVQILSQCSGQLGGG